MKVIEFNDKQIPVHFGVAARAEAMTMMGLSLQQDGFAKITLTMESMQKIAFTGIKHGARKAGQQFTQSYYDWCDTLDDVPNYMDLISKCVEVFSEESSDQTEGNAKGPAKARAKK